MGIPESCGGTGGVSTLVAECVTQDDRLVVGSAGVGAAAGAHAWVARSHKSSVDPERCTAACVRHMAMAPQSEDLARRSRFWLAFGQSARSSHRSWSAVFGQRLGVESATQRARFIVGMQQNWVATAQVYSAVNDVRWSSVGGPLSTFAPAAPRYRRPSSRQPNLPPLRLFPMRRPCRCHHPPLRLLLLSLQPIPLRPLARGSSGVGACRPAALPPAPVVPLPPAPAPAVPRRFCRTRAATGRARRDGCRAFGPAGS